jgi:glycosyltransferase involved in cell wall biosynthesis
VRPDHADVGLRFAPAEPAWHPLLRRDNHFADALEAEASSSDTVVHDHGVWMPSNHAAATAARRLGAPLVVTTRGMLTMWALGQSRVKKRAAWLLYQGRDLRSAKLLHATAESEVEDIRRIGLRQPVIVLPNGVEVPELARGMPSGPRRRALFLSRVHPKKGLLNLVEAWAEVRPENWELVIAGPDEDGHRAEVEAHARIHSVDIVWTGPVADDAKWDLYRSADLFVLPTFSENFGIVVAEALAVGVPALTTTGAPWELLNRERCGWWIDIGVEPLVAALREATELDDEARHAMGRRGRTYVREHLSWDHVANGMLAAYRWLVGRRERPTSVVVE